MSVPTMTQWHNSNKNVAVRDCTFQVLSQTTEELLFEPEAEERVMRCFKT